MKKYSIIAEVAVWLDGEFRRVAAFRERIRRPDVSVYIDVGPIESQWVLSYHASGQINSKVVDSDGTVFKRSGKGKLPSGKTLIEMWTEDELVKSDSEERRILSPMIFLKTDQFPSYPICEFKPEIIFTLDPGQETLGLAFYPMTMGNRHIPVPTTNMAFGYTDATLPPIFVLANYASAIDFELAKHRIYDDPSFDTPPHIAFSQVLNKGLFPVVCHPKFEKPIGMMIRVMNESYYPPLELTRAYDSLPIRPGKVDFPVVSGKEIDLNDDPT